MQPKSCQETTLITSPEPPPAIAGSSAQPEPNPREAVGRTLRTELGEFVLMLFVNAVLGAIASVILKIPMIDSLEYSYAIGWSIYLISRSLSRYFGAQRADARALVIAVPVGCLAGMILGSVLTHDGLLDRMLQRDARAFGALVLPLAASAAASYYFYSRGLLAERDAQLKEAQLTRAEERQRASDAQLKVLQAQIEPHFLFNTLSNVVGMIDERPQAAKDMLVDLTRLLRRSLLRARADTLPLAEEIADIRAYLEIQAQRLGPRLRYAIEVDPALTDVAVAPYLLQPLVENALRHGLEPMIDGGEVRIGITRAGTDLRIEVADTGRGLRNNQEPGVALANIRARLAVLYGPAGHLSLHPNVPSGVVARLVFPLPAAS